MLRRLALGMLLLLWRLLRQRTARLCRRLRSKRLPLLLRLALKRLARTLRPLRNYRTGCPGANGGPVEIWRQRLAGARQYLPGLRRGRNRTCGDGRLLWAVRGRARGGAAGRRCHGWWRRSSAAGCNVLSRSRRGRGRLGRGLSWSSWSSRRRRFRRSSRNGWFCCYRRRWRLL